MRYLCCRHLRRLTVLLVGIGLIGKLLAATLGGEAAEPKPVFPPEGPAVPRGLVPIIWPDDNPYTPAKAELGWLLFFDPRLSSDGSVSCASCHSPAHAFTDGRPVSTGIGRQQGGRSAPSIINRVYGAAQFWDGRAASLEEQAKGPLANPLEMTHEKDTGRAHATTVQRLGQVTDYRKRFKEVFGDEKFTIDHLAQAIATFERTVLSGNAPYDRFKAGDTSALSAGQQRGMNIFFSNNARCDSCHDGAAFTTNQFANIGIGMDKAKPDLGRYNVTHNEADKGAFKTPGLREVALSGPYMHDGSLKTLEEVVEHYNKGGIKNRWLHQDIRPLNLTVQDKKDLVDFLHALSGEGWQHIKAPASLPK